MWRGERQGSAASNLPLGNMVMHVVVEFGPDRTKLSAYIPLLPADARP